MKSVALTSTDPRNDNCNIEEVIMRTTRAFLILFAVVISVLLMSCGMMLPAKQIWTCTSDYPTLRFLVIANGYIQFVQYVDGQEPIAEALVPYSVSEDGSVSVTYTRGVIDATEVDVLMVQTDETTITLSETVGGVTTDYVYTLDEETGEFVENYAAEKSDSGDMFTTSDGIISESSLYLFADKSFRWVGYIGSHNGILLASGTFVYDNGDPANLTLHLNVTYKYNRLLPAKVPGDFTVTVSGTSYTLHSTDGNFTFEH